MMEPIQSDTPGPSIAKRSGFQFNVRTLLLAMLTLSLLIAAWSWLGRREVRVRRLVAELKALGGDADSKGTFFIAPSRAALDLVLTSPKDEIQTLGLGYPAKNDDSGSSESSSSKATDIDDASLAKLEALPELRRLVIRHARITDDAVAVIGRLLKLELLELDRNPLSDEGISPLKDLARLKTLRLKNTDLTDRGLACVTTLTQLTALDLSGTQLSDDGMVHLAGLTNLTTLNLSRTKITDQGLARLSALTRLVRLELNETQVTGAGFESLAVLTKLQWLDLAKSQVSDAELPRLRSLQQLGRLNLNETRITDAAVESLEALPNLEVIELKGTPMSQEAQQVLQTTVSKRRSDRKQKSTQPPLENDKRL